MVDRGKEGFFFNGLEERDGGELVGAGGDGAEEAPLGVGDGHEKGLAEVGHCVAGDAVDVAHQGARAKGVAVAGAGEDGADEQTGLALQDGVSEDRQQRLGRHAGGL